MPGRGGGHAATVDFYRELRQLIEANRIGVEICP
jgi:hypothetical protein